MASPGGTRSDRVRLLLAAALISAVACGIAASYLAGPPGSVGPGPSSSPGLVPFTVVGGAAGILVLLLIGVMIFYRASSGRSSRLFAMLPGALAVFLVALAFLVAVRFVSQPETFNTVPSGNRTAAPPTPPPNTSNLTTLTPGPIAPGIPGWVGFVLLAVIVGVTLLLVAPALARRPVPGPPPAPRPALQRALEEAHRSLAPGAGEDPRSVMLVLYGRFLEAVAPFLENLDSATAREIERVSVERFDVPAGPAHELTDLFEEARYSSHPFTAEQVTRAERALEGALARLRARSYSGGG